MISRTLREFEELDKLIAKLSNEDWGRLVIQPEWKDPWTVKDALANITHRKAASARSARRQRRLPDERGLPEKDANRLIYQRWRDRTPQEILALHRLVQQEVLAKLRAAPEEWFRRTHSRGTGDRGLHDPLSARFQSERLKFEHEVSHNIALSIYCRTGCRSVQ